MSKRNNLFHFATSELSQDAFIAWLLSFAMKEHEQEDAALAQCARALLQGMYPGMASDEYVTSIELQHNNIDVLVTLENCSIIIEDKSKGTKASSKKNVRERRFARSITR